MVGRALCFVRIHRKSTHLSSHPLLEALEPVPICSQQYRGLSCSNESQVTLATEQLLAEISLDSWLCRIGALAI